MNQSTEGKWTTVKISKQTLRLLIKLKGLMERNKGVSLNLDYAISRAALYADWALAKELGLTKLDYKKYAQEMLEKVKVQEGKTELDLLFEEPEDVELFDEVDQDKK